ncbi:hypothetical protein WG66_005574 [Moniliophthora roreri]|nr:hypothetical protein WG66_005574 [Moniliophthora roreri]
MASIYVHDSSCSYRFEHHKTLSIDKLWSLGPPILVDSTAVCIMGLWGL